LRFVNRGGRFISASNDEEDEEEDEEDEDEDENEGDRFICSSIITILIS
jgi:hypothetical protein